MQRLLEVTWLIFGSSLNPFSALAFFAVAFRGFLHVFYTHFVILPKSKIIILIYIMNACVFVCVCLSYSNTTVNLISISSVVVVVVAVVVVTENNSNAYNRITSSGGLFQMNFRTP